MITDQTPQQVNQALSQRDREFAEAVKRVGEQFNWDLNAFFAHVQEEQRKRHG